MSKHADGKLNTMTYAAKMWGGRACVLVGRVARKGWASTRTGAGSIGNFMQGREVHMYTHTQVRVGELQCKVVQV